MVDGKRLLHIHSLLKCMAAFFLKKGSVERAIT